MKITSEKVIILSGNDLRKLERGETVIIDDVALIVNHSSSDDEHRTNQPMVTKKSW